MMTLSLSYHSYPLASPLHKAPTWMVWTNFMTIMFATLQRKPTSKMIVEHHFKDHLVLAVFNVQI